MAASILRKGLNLCLSATLAILGLLPAATAEVPGAPDGPNQALGISANFAKWTDNPVTGVTIDWVYNSTGAPNGWTDDATTAAAFQAALDEWSGVCDLSFNYLGVDDTADYTNNGDGVAVFTWGNLGGAAGIAGPSSTSATESTLGRWNYVDGSLRMDIGVFTQGGGATPAQILVNEVSFHSTAVHEVGHLIGLGHSDRPDSIMFANPYNSIISIKEDDRQACRAMYGYSGVHDPSPAYEPPADGVNTYNTLFVSSSSNPFTPISSDNGSFNDTDTVFLVYQNTSGGYSDTLTQIVIDPDGYISLAADTAVMSSGSTFAFGIANFGRLREYPGVWSVVAYDSTGRLGTFTIDVTTSIPVVNNPPNATFEFTEAPNDRDVSVTVNISSDDEGDSPSAIWHIPGSSPITPVIGALPDSDSQVVTFNDSLEHEIFLQVNDDDVRYDPVGSGSLGPPGVGFQRLFRYYSNDLRSRVNQDGTGGADILWRNSATGQNWLYLMNGATISTTTQINVESNTDWTVAGAGDYNQDGKTDIVWRNLANGQNWMYQMDGQTILQSIPINVVSNQDWQIAGTGDYDGDNNADILWRNSVSGEVLLDRMRGNLVVSSERIAIVSNTNWQIAASDDFNGDGKSDLLWRNAVTGANWMYLLDGSAILSSVAVNNVANLSWTIAGTGDFNADGFADILWRNTATGQNWIYFMNGSLISSSVALNVVGNTNWIVAGIGDYDDDGDADILWREITDGNNWMYLMNGSMISQSSKVNRVANQNWIVVNPR